MKIYSLARSIVFRDLLSCILCYEDDEEPFFSENPGHYGSARLPDNSFSRTARHTSDSSKGKQVCYQDTIHTSGTIQNKSKTNSSRMSTGSSKQSKENVVSFKLLDNVKSGDAVTRSDGYSFISHYNHFELPASLSSPKIPATSSINCKPALASTSQKMSEATTKLNFCSLTPSPVKACQQKSTYCKDVLVKGNASDAIKNDALRIINKSDEPSDQKPKDVLRVAFSDCSKSFLFETRPVIFSNPEKSSNVSERMKDSPSAMVLYSTVRTKETKAETNKIIDLQQVQDVSSPKLPPSSVKSLCPAPSSEGSNQKKTSYIWVEKGASTSHKLNGGTTEGKICSLTPSPVKACRKDNTHSITETKKTVDQKPVQDVSFEQPPHSIKPIIRPTHSSQGSYQKGSYVWVEKGASPTYACPSDIKNLLEKDIVPGVLKKPLSMSTYKEYFQALLYAEDVYFEKWDGFQIEDVTLQLQKAEISKMQDTTTRLDKCGKKVEKTFVEFKIDEIPERRPFLLSRDFVTLQPLRNRMKTFQGIIYKVKRSNLILAEFGEDFLRQHDPAESYDITFSFNRVCLKRAQQAILAASDNLFRNFLFPNSVEGNEIQSPGPYNYHIFGGGEKPAIQPILSLKGLPPYLVQGPISSQYDCLSETGQAIVDTITQISRSSTLNRILLCAPTNKRCDVLMRALKNEIAESDMFRANAAFREYDEVPEDILPSCFYKEKQECFTCPPLDELQKFKVILSTFMSSFRLHNVGILAGHFSHIFLVDASSTIEPETLVPLVHFATERTTVVVSGARWDRSRWVRSNIARENGLRISYFERLSNRKSKLVENLEP